MKNDQKQWLIAIRRASFGGRFIAFSIAKIIRLGGSYYNKRLKFNF